MHERAVSFRWLSRRTGLAPATLNEYTNGHKTPRTSTIEAIAAALEVAPESFLEWRRRHVLERVGAADDRVVEALYERLR